MLPAALRPLVVLIICTWSRPHRLARYNAASAAARRSGSVLSLPASSAATPTDTVTCTASPPAAPGAMIDSAAIFDRIRSAMRIASGALVCGSRTENSSPPNLPTRL